LTLGLCLAFAPSAQAATFGISDDDTNMFSSHHFRALGIKQARLTVPWNVALSTKGQPAWGTNLREARHWLNTARASGVQPLVSFNVAIGGRNNRRAPSLATYRRAFRTFRKRFPWVRQYIPWNEVNHGTQPTAKKPKLAAQYYNIAPDNCRRCTVVAAALLDEKSAVPFIKQFKRYAKRPRLWVLHNYLAVNRTTTVTMRRILKTARGRFWITESGGIVMRKSPFGKSNFSFSPARAARAEKNYFRLVARYRRQVKRFYHYQWQNTGNPVWDSALIGANGKPRPAYWIVKHRVRR